jgi:hypothetical protein
MPADRKALIVGIDSYDVVNSLTVCVNDATAMVELFSRNEDGTPNFECKKLTSPGPILVTKIRLRQLWHDLFQNFNGDVLFYFSGHGTPTEVGGYLVTQDGTIDDPGLPMNDLLTIANRSRARSVLIITDCCYSGDLGNPPSLQDGQGSMNQAQLREGVTILSASRPSQVSAEIGQHGVFTELVIGALEGGASDVRGRVSAASVYAYVEQALGAWEQRPMYKSHADSLAPIRRCKPRVEDTILRDLPELFVTSESTYKMDPTYEHTVPNADHRKVELFDKFKILRDASLLRVEDNLDLYYAALQSKGVFLTPLGKFYWRLADQGRI